MSFQLVDLVRDHSKARGLAKLVLIVIASRINQHTGEAFPSIFRLAKDAGIQERSVQRIILRLEISKELIVIRASPHDQAKRGRQGTNRYRINIGMGDTVSPESGMQGNTSEECRTVTPPATESHPPGDTVSPESVTESVNESNKEKKKVGVSILMNPEEADDLVRELDDGMGRWTIKQSPPHQNDFKNGYISQSFYYWCYRLIVRAMIQRRGKNGFVSFEDFMSGMSEHFAPTSPMFFDKSENEHFSNFVVNKIMANADSGIAGKTGKQILYHWAKQYSDNRSKQAQTESRIASANKVSR